jgi:hypothetical protein
MVSWLGEQPQVKSFSETKLLFPAHRLRQALLSWERFSEQDASEGARRFIRDGYAREGVYLGSSLLLDKEPLDPLSISPSGYGSFLSSVEAIFPSARFVVMVRNPVAVVSSVVNRKWGFSLQNEEASGRTIEEGITIWRVANMTLSTIAPKENIYLCSFEDLIKQPKKESKTIAQFLGLKDWHSFSPRETSEITLSDEERRRVWEETTDIRHHLAQVGVSYAPDARIEEYLD